MEIPESVAQQVAVIANVQRERIVELERQLAEAQAAERHRCRLAVCPLCNAGEAVEKHESGVWYHLNYRLCRAYKILEMDSEC